MFDGEAALGPRMKDFGRRQPFARQSGHPFPGRVVLLAAPPKRASPEVDDMVAECADAAGVGGRGVVVEPALDHRAEPFALSSQRLMHAFSQAFFDLLELRPHAVAPNYRDALLNPFSCDSTAKRQQQKRDSVRRHRNT